MSRPVRVEYPGAYYHVMHRGLDRQKVFLGDADYREFVALMEDIVHRWSVNVFAYCCMSDHYHLFLQTPQGNLSRVMRHVDGLYTQRFNRNHHRDGPLFRGRYKALLVDGENYLLAVVRYIHLNPVHAGLVVDPGAYPWSSHGLYRLPMEQRPPWLAWTTVLHFFPHPERFEEFVAAGNNKTLAAFYESKRWSPFLGDTPFYQQALQKAHLSSNHPRAERTPQFPTLDAVAQKVASVFRVPIESLYQSHRGRENVARNAAIYLASRTAGFSHRAIQDVFKLRSDSAVSRVNQRMVQRLKKNRRLREQLRRLGSGEM